MAKNPRRHQKESSPTRQATTITPPSVSQRGKKVIALGIGIVVLGFWVLSYTDPAGQNWASTLSPALLIAGYVLIGVGIVLPDISTSGQTAQTPGGSTSSTKS